MGSSHKNYHVAVIGAGPAGLYAAQYLARQGVQVAVFNRDIKPGGLAEYGIFPDKHKMRTGLMAQFKRILKMPNVRYQGNVRVGQSGDIKLDQLRKAGFQAFMVTTGAQQNYWLGLPGEDLDGVYHANDIVFHYNRLPGHTPRLPVFGAEIAVIGVGNVMLDIVNYLECNGHIGRVTAYARRGPTEVKFDQQTLEPVAGCLDLVAIEAAVAAADLAIENVGRDVRDFWRLLADAREKALDCDPGLSFQMQFLKSPRRLIGDAAGRVKAVVLEINQLVRESSQVNSRGSGKLETVQADTVIFSIGSQVEPGFGLPVTHGNFVTTPNPRFPVDGISYEVYNPALCTQCEDIFVSGWSRVAGEGVVGLARKDAERGAKALLRYLDTLQHAPGTTLEEVLARLPNFGKKVVNTADLEILWEAENRVAAEKGLAEFKFDSNAEMLNVIERGSKGNH